MNAQPPKVPLLKRAWFNLCDSIDGKKLWTAVIGAVALYGIPFARAKWPMLPWDQVLIPLLAALGLVGAGHKYVKAKGIPDRIKKAVQKKKG
jgi:hypothetical protein